MKRVTYAVICNELNIVNKRLTQQYIPANYDIKQKNGKWGLYVQFTYSNRGWELLTTGTFKGLLIALLNHADAMYMDVYSKLPMSPVRFITTTIVYNDVMRQDDTITENLGDFESHQAVLQRNFTEDVKHIIWTVNGKFVFYTRHKPFYNPSLL